MAPHPRTNAIVVAMHLPLLACQLLVDAMLESVFFEIAMEAACVAERYRCGARTLSELRGEPGLVYHVPTGRAATRGVNIRIDRWIVELIEELIETPRPSHVRAFVRDAVLAYVDQLVIAGQSDG